MPPWFIDIESATEMEAKSNGIPPASRTAAQASRAKPPSSALHGVTRPSVEATPTNGLSRSAFFTPSAPRNARCGARSSPSTVIRDGSDFFFIFGNDFLDAGASLETAVRDRGLRRRIHDGLKPVVRSECHLALGTILHGVPHLSRADADSGEKERSGHGSG